MEKTVTIKYLRTSPKKLRAVINNVKGMKVAEALPLLKVNVKQAGTLLYKAVKSAQFLFDKALHNDVVVKNIVVNAGPKFKRFRPGSKGMAHPYVRRTAHVVVTVTVPTMKKDEATKELKKVTTTPAPVKAEVKTKK